MNAKPITEHEKSTWKQAGCLFLFGMVFFCAGVGVLIFTLLIPWLSSRASQNWSEVPCKIVASRVEIHRGDESTSYSVEAKYTYEVDQQTFTSQRYDFNATKRSRRKCKEIVDQLPAGKETVCFVDPHDPQSAVLNREFLMSWMTLVFGLIFSTVGAFVAIGLPMFANRPNKIKKAISSSSGSATAHGLQSTDRISSGLYEEDLEDQQWDVPQRLKPSTTKVGTLAGIIFFALFWNGIVSVFLWNGIAGFDLGFFSIFMLLFMIPFVLVGLLLIFGVVISFLSLFNPVFEIAMSTGAITRGDTVDVAWEIKGNANRIRRLRIAAAGTESAQYQQGTSTYTDNSEFGMITIADTTDAQEISFGSVAVTIPADAMHTFADQHNKVTWAIHLRAEIAKFPDVFQKHNFRVKP